MPQTSPLSPALPPSTLSRRRSFRSPPAIEPSLNAFAQRPEPIPVADNPYPRPKQARPDYRRHSRTTRAPRECCSANVHPSGELLRTPLPRAHPSLPPSRPTTPCSSLPELATTANSLSHSVHGEIHLLAIAQSQPAGSTVERHTAHSPFFPCLLTPPSRGIPLPTQMMTSSTPSWCSVNCPKVILVRVCANFVV